MIFRLLAFAVASCLAPRAAEAAPNLDSLYYKGRTVTLIVGYPSGGSKDIYSRILAEFYGRHIPGNPTVIVRNMPGGGSYAAGNYVYDAAPSDGTYICLGAPTFSLDERIGIKGLNVKTAKVNWIGRIDTLVNVLMTWRTSPVKTIEDAKARTATLGGTGVGSTVAIYPVVLNKVIGTKFKVVMGYPGSNQAMMAMETGEVEGHSTAWDAIKTEHPDWIQKGSVNLLVQFALSRAPDLPQVPTVLELTNDTVKRQILSAIMNATEVGTSYFAGPGVPQDRVKILRTAFEDTMHDEQFIASLKTARLGFDPLSGEKLQKVVTEVSVLPPEIIDKVRDAMEVPVN